ncbi:MAG TPA: hypothetical protein VGE09_06595 [Pseudoxanthomonas sp.]
MPGFLAAPRFPLVDALPAAADVPGGFLRTVEGLWYSDGTDWGRVDAPGVFAPVTAAEYAALDPEDQDDAAVLWVIVASTSGLRVTRTWTEVTSAPGSPDSGTLYVVNP